MKRTLNEKLDGAYFAPPPEKESYWVHIPAGDDWIAAQRLIAQDGAVVVAELRLFPRERVTHVGGEWSTDDASVPEGGASAALVRSVSVGGHAVAPVLTDWLEAHLYSRPDRDGVAIDWDPKARAFAANVEKEFGLRVKDWRADATNDDDHDRAFYEQVAQDYVRWFRDSPAKRISEDRGVKRNTVRTWIHTARHRYGLLPETKTGKLPLGSLMSQSARKK